MNYKIILLAISFTFSFACMEKPKTDITIETDNVFDPMYSAPDWSKNANIYEVNIRQYTAEGTFNAFSTHLPRLKELGVDILWLMPINPIGIVKRKGDLGSPYSIKDYKALNEDYGNELDFQNLVDEVHALGMKIILDWVPNHSSFDNVWIYDHPEWYTKDADGNIIHPKNTDWTDVADLNYDNMNMRKEMTASMVYWVEHFNIDGFRCDVAGEVPNDFWIENNKTLQSKKHLFLLAEWDEPSLHEVGFHMTYGWGFHHVMNEIAKGKNGPSDIDKFMTKDQDKYDNIDYRMNFITNHDENTWNGTIKERLGDAGDLLAVLAFTVQGMPLIYSGQEAGLAKRLSFFGKDEIDWSDLSKSNFYKKLLELKHENKAIWNGAFGGTLVRLSTNNDGNIYAYSRSKAENEVLVILNVSDQEQKFNFKDLTKTGIYKNIFTDEKIEMSTQIEIEHKLEPWSYKVWAK